MLRRTRVDQPHVTRLGLVTTNREKIIAKLFFLRDIRTLEPLSASVLLDPRGAFRNPVSLFSTLVARTGLLHRSSLALVISRHECLSLTVRGSFNSATLLLALHVLVQQPRRH